MSDNPYLALRESKIARNEERLRQLGLLKKRQQQQQRHPTEERSQKKRKSDPPRRIQPKRRSQRISKAGTEAVYSNGEQVIVEKQPTKSRPVVVKKTEQERAPAAPNSIRRITVSVPKIVNKFLGRTLSNTGKASVIQSVLESDDNNISFNKYSGILEWQNDALFLWVNVTSDSMNEFLKAGQQMTWFGGSRMHEESPIIQKLFRTIEGGRVDDGILLWCRHYNPKTKTHHPYTCLGRLSYHSHIPQSRPLQFVWNLDDYPTLIEHYKQRFQEIILSA